MSLTPPFRRRFTSQKNRSRAVSLAMANVDDLGSWADADLLRRLLNQDKLGGLVLSYAFDLHAQGMHSRAQCFQDVFALLATPQPSTFLEIGVGDGIHISNTALLESAGWTGVLVEADPGMARLVRRNRPHSVIVERAVFPGEERVVEFVSCGELSTLAASRPRDAWAGKRSRAGRTAWVTTISPRRLAEEYLEGTEHGFLSLDTEGSELAILEDFPLDSMSFAAVSIENSNDADKQSKIRSVMSRAGYVDVPTSLSRWDSWFVHPDRASNRILSVL